MRVKVKDFRVVEKDTHTFDDGTTIYRCRGGNGVGSLVQMGVPEEVWPQLVPFDAKYDIEIELSTSGYKTYCDLVGIKNA